MINKLLLSTLAIVSTINLANAQSDPKEIAYPVDIIAGGRLNLTGSTTGYKFTAACSASSEDSAKAATLSANKDVIYEDTFSATGNAVLNYGNVTFRNGLTLAASNGQSPTMKVSGDMIITGSGTINTGNSTIEFDGDESELDLSNAYSTIFTCLNAEGKDSGKKLTINYGGSAVRDDYGTYRNSLSNILTNMTFTNAQIEDIWVTGDTVKSGGDSGKRLKTAAKSSGSGYNVFIEDLGEASEDVRTSGERFINDTLRRVLTNKNITIVEASDDNDMDDVEDETGGTAYTVDFGADMNKETDGVTPNSGGNTFIDWSKDDTYDLDSSATSTATSYTFDLDIQPGSAKTLHLSSTNTNLNTVIFNGAQNNNLTVSLQSASLKTVQFSPAKNSYCKIDATTMGDDLALNIADATSTTDFTVNAIPTVASTKVYSLTIGKNVNVKLGSAEFGFSSITADEGAKITVGDGAILNL